MRDTLLLIGVVGFGSGILCRSFLFSGWVVIGALLLLGALMLFGFFYTRHTVVLGVSVWVLMCALGVLRSMFVVDYLPPAQVPLLQAPRVLDGVVRADPDVRETSQRVVVEVTAEHVHARVLVVASLYPELMYGDQVRVEGARALPQPFATDGGRVFDYRAFLARDGIFLMVPRAHVTVVGVEHSVSTYVMRALLTWKHAFERGLSVALREPATALASGILVGGKQGLGRELLDAFTVSGLLPIVVLSGYNVMIIAEAVMRMLRKLPRTIAAATAGVVIACFILVAGLGASAVRAGLMAGLALFARATSRTYDALRALVFVFVILIAWNPLLLAYDPGFQFSFAAAIGLILFGGPIADRLRFISSGTLREVVGSTIAAQLMVLPLLLYETGNLSLVALPANVLALPVIPLAMLLSAVAGVAGMVLPGIAPVIAFPAHLALTYVILVARTTAALPYAHVTLPTFPFPVVLGAYVLIFVLYAHMKRTTPAQSPVPG